jgi:hypothetical protein
MVPNVAAIASVVANIKISDPGASNENKIAFGAEFDQLPGKSLYQERHDMATQDAQPMNFSIPLRGTIAANGIVVITMGTGQCIWHNRVTTQPVNGCRVSATQGSSISVDALAPRGQLWQSARSLSISPK